MREWCQATDTAPWQPGECANFAVRDFDVGLLIKVNDQREMLHVFADLGVQSSPVLLEHLLRLNCDLGVADHGSYALHPDNDAIVYRMSICLTEAIDGATLPQLLESRLDEARVRVIS